MTYSFTNFIIFTDKLNINYIKTESINFGNININLNNNLNTNSGINNQLNSFSKETSNPPSSNMRDNSANLIKNKLVNLNNSINTNLNNKIVASNTLNKIQKPSFSSSIKEKNKLYQTLDEEGAAYLSNNKYKSNNLLSEDGNTNANDAKKSGSIKSIQSILLIMVYKS